NSNVDFSTATPSVPYTLHTLTPDQQAWFTTNGVTWPSDITATAWLPADNTLGANNQRLGTPYSNITAGATTTVFADQRPLYPTYTQALSSVANHLYSTIPVTNATNPTNQTVSIGSSTSFSSIVSLANPALSPTYTPTYQWQVSIDSGSNWSNLTDGAGISGSGTTALSLTNIPYAWNGYWYRLAIKTPLLSGTPNTGSAVLRTTAPATLTVNAPTITLSADSTVPIDVQPGKFSSNYGNVTVDYDGTSGVSLSMSLVNASNSSLVNTQDSTTTISSLSSQCWQINPCGFTQANNNMGGTSWWGWAFGNNGEGWNNFDDMTTETNVSASTHTWAAVAPDLSDGDISTLTTGFNGSYPFPWTAKVYFGVYASPIQKSGTYVGQVLYTAVAGI
ncbi:hypothetical protein FWF48_01915, partial [Candidatus Saccharibacteria bacterium]|nr:hypothetical protein [Candidatus Saccharibacteria bacterium]